MKNIYVKWDFTDDYGRVYEENANFDWFETQEQADAFIAKMRKGNGGYFKLWKVAEGDFNQYLRMHELMAEVAKMRKGNGGYFKLWEVTEDDFNQYLRMHELMAEVAKIKKEFE